MSRRVIDPLLALKARGINVVEVILTVAAPGSVGDPVVEIGCGPGHVGAFLQARGRHVVGLDLSIEMARLAGRRLEAALTADMRALPFASAQVGGLLAFYSLIHGGDLLRAGRTRRRDNSGGLDVTIAERRPPYATETGTVRLYVEAERRPAR